MCTVACKKRLIFKAKGVLLAYGVSARNQIVNVHLAVLAGGHARADEHEQATGEAANWPVPARQRVSTS